MVEDVPHTRHLRAPLEPSCFLGWELIRALAPMVAGLVIGVKADKKKLEAFIRKL